MYRNSLTFLFLLVTYCTNSNGAGVVFYANQFMYSSNRSFAFGLTDSTFGIYYASTNGSIGSMFWNPSYAIAAGYRFVAQDDGSLIL